MNCSSDSLTNSIIRTMFSRRVYMSENIIKGTPTGYTANPRHENATQRRRRTEPSQSIVSWALRKESPSKSSQMKVWTCERARDSRIMAKKYRYYPRRRELTIVVEADGNRTIGMRIDKVATALVTTSCCGWSLLNTSSGMSQRQATNTNGPIV